MTTIKTVLFEGLALVGFLWATGFCLMSGCAVVYGLAACH